MKKFLLSVVLLLVVSSQSFAYNAFEAQQMGVLAAEHRTQFVLPLGTAAYNAIVFLEAGEACDEEWEEFLQAGIQDQWNDYSEGYESAGDGDFSAGEGDGAFEAGDYDAAHDHYSDAVQYYIHAEGMFGDIPQACGEIAQMVLDGCQ